MRQDSATEPVLYRKDGAVAWVTLNRPASLNAINLVMRDLLWDIFGAIRDDPEVRVAVIAGAGARALSSGADINDFGTAPSYLAARSARRDRDLWGLLLALPKPTIAAVHGIAYGAGCEMALCCDLRIAADDARFALPEVSLGYIPSAGGTQLLPRVAGRELALRMILSGDPIGAEDARRAGLVTAVVPGATLVETVQRAAERLLRQPAAALRYAKEAIVDGLDLTLAQGLALEARLASLTFSATAGD